MKAGVHCRVASVAGTDPLRLEKGVGRQAARHIGRHGRNAQCALTQILIDQVATTAFIVSTVSLVVDQPAIAVCRSSIEVASAQWRSLLVR